MRAEFDIIGNIGSITVFDKVLKVSVCANYPKKLEDGSYENDEYWNQISIFDEKLRKYAEAHLAKGDLIAVRGRTRRSEYEKDGQTVYAQDFIVSRINRLHRKEADAENKE